MLERIFLVLSLLIGGLGSTSAALAGEAVVSWDPPTTNSDGTFLTDLAGYKIYYGASSGIYDTFIDVNNVITYTFSSLEEGKTYYFSATAYDSSGNESKYSNEVSKTILATPLGNVDITTPGSTNRVDGYDLIAMKLAWGSTLSDVNWNALADLDGNGLIDEADLNILTENFGVIK